MSGHEQRVEVKLDKIISLLEKLVGEVPKAKEEAANPFKNITGLRNVQHHESGHLQLRELQGVAGREES